MIRRSSRVNCGPTRVSHIESTAHADEPMGLAQRRSSTAISMKHDRQCSHNRNCALCHARLHCSLGDTRSAMPAQPKLCSVRRHDPFALFAVSLQSAERDAGFVVCPTDPATTAAPQAIAGTAQDLPIWEPCKSDALSLELAFGAHRPRRPLFLSIQTVRGMPLLGVFHTLLSR